MSPDQPEDDGTWGPPPLGEPASLATGPPADQTPRQTPDQMPGQAAGRPDEQTDDQPFAQPNEPEDATADEPADEAADEQAVPEQMDVVQWVEEIFKPMIERKVTARGTTWCDRWTHHPEAVVRLDALRSAWYEMYAIGEDGRLADPTGPSAFWIYHIDAHLHVLLDGETGPMAGCRPGSGGHATTPVPTFSEL